MALPRQAATRARARHAPGVIFTTYGTVASQGSMTALVSASTGKAMVKHPAKLRAWRETIGYDARRAMCGRDPMEGPLHLRASFYLPRGKSVKRKRPSVKPDLDKLLRAVGDALEGIVYVNDSQIVWVLAEKFYGEPSRVVIAVTEVT